MTYKKIVCACGCGKGLPKGEWYEKWTDGKPYLRDHTPRFKQPKMEVVANGG